MSNAITNDPVFLVAIPSGKTCDDNEIDLVERLLKPVQYSFGLAPPKSSTSLLSIEFMSPAATFETARPVQWSAQHKPTRDEVRQMDVYIFLEYIYQLVNDNESLSASIDVIDYIDRLHSLGRFSDCKKMLSQLLLQGNLPKFPSHLRRAFLMITYPAKDKLLPERMALYQESIRMLSAERGPLIATQTLKSLA